MSDLFDKSIRTLELPRVLELLSEQAVSAEARQRALRLRPETEPEEVLRLLDQTDAARNLIGLRGSPSFSGVKPVAEALDRADRGGALNTRELLTIADLLTAARRAKEYFNDEAAEKTAIDHLFLSLHGNRFLEEKIKRAIPDEDTIADAASTELADIRRHMRAAQAKSRQILQRIISSPSYGKILQETIITQRDGRFVVPVKAEHKGDLPGLVHDISSTGATLFVEPMGVVQANNEYIELQAKEQKEIDRILAEFSAEAAAHREDIQWDYDTLVHLDLIFARGQLSYKMNAVRPEVRRDGAIHLRKARHPLLDPKTAVPIDIELGDTFDTLVITGPNTGGKTVTLKTLGLLTLMTQCGLHIPAADRSAVSVYERVLADIGDEQSIEQSLSTFSAHMVNIVEILKEADRHSLVLFDELGAGTDPVEGAALAIAVIQHVRRLGAKVAATTHYAELKVYAMTTAGVENALQAVESCGHGTVVTTPDGRMFFLCHAYLSGENFFLGRQPILSRIELGEDGWLHFEGGETALLRRPLPLPGTAQEPVKDFADDFSSPRIRPEWSWNYPYAVPDVEQADGRLCLSGRAKEGVHTGVAFCLRALTTDYTLETACLARPAGWSGLTLYGDDRNLLVWGLQDGRLAVRLVRDGRRSCSAGLSPFRPMSPFTCVWRCGAAAPRPSRTASTAARGSRPERGPWSRANCCNGTASPVRDSITKVPRRRSPNSNTSG